MEPAWEPNPYRASPAIHTPTDTLNFTSLWSRRRSYHQMPPPPLLTGGKEGGPAKLLGATATVTLEPSAARAFVELKFEQPIHLTAGKY